MRTPCVQFTVRWVVLAVILVAIMAVLATIERRERLRSEIAIVRAETAYRDAKLARELAEAAVNEYAKGTFRRELATVEEEIKEAEDNLKRTRFATAASLEWAERIRSKGYLLLIGGVDSGMLGVKMATFAVECAKTKRAVLEGYIKVETVKKLNDQVAKAKEDELAKKAVYDGVRATPVGFIRKVIRRK